MQQRVLCCAYIVRHIVCYGCLFWQQFIYMFPRHNLCIRCALYSERVSGRSVVVTCVPLPPLPFGVLVCSVSRTTRTLALSISPYLGLGLISYTQIVAWEHGWHRWSVVWVIGRRSALSQCASESIALWKDTFIDTTYTFVHWCKQYTQTYIHTPLVVKVIPPREE